LSRVSQFDVRPSFRFWVLAGYLAFVFLLGGGSRDDIQSLLLLRPAAVAMCGVAIVMLPAGAARAYRGLLWFAAALFGLCIVQLIPLPPALWTTLPGREIIVAIDAAAGLAGTWRPISMDPHGTWNAFYSLFVPLAALLLAAPLTREERFGTLVLVLTLGLLSGLIGLLQVSGGRDSGLYLYRITTPGYASGFFANRNHQAALLATLLPMLAVFGWVGVRTLDQARLRWALCLAAGGVLVPLLLVTGSRTGFVLGLLGLLSVPFLYRRRQLDDVASRQRRQRSMLIPLSAGAVVISILTLITVLFARAEAIRRVLAPDQGGDLRFKFWGPITELTARYFPFGTGFGSFDPVFRLNEPDALLRPTYFNHAHNDWLEIVLTGGIGAVALATIAVLWWAFRTLQAWRGDGTMRDVAFARLGSMVLIMMALASVTDYPLRVPSMMCVAVMAAMWLHGGSSDRARGARSALDVSAAIA
jgi:O-antigen ligase